MHPETAAVVTTTEITRTGYFYKYTCSNQSLNLCVLWDACYELFCVFGVFYASRTQDAEVTKSLHGGVPNTATPLEKLANTEILCRKSTKYQ